MRGSQNPTGQARTTAAGAEERQAGARERRPATRGRIDKREAILGAALWVFAREGYAQANLDVVAAEAGVAKPTIYNHFGDKERLFRQVLTDVAARAAVRTLAVVETLPTDPADLRAELETVAYKYVECANVEDAMAVRRLLYAEAVRFPDLLETVWASGPDQVTEALAGRLARLANAGYLRIPDPVRAARQFHALVSGELPALTALDTRPVDEGALRRAATAGVDTFLRAFG